MPALARDQRNAQSSAGADAEFSSLAMPLPQQGDEGRGPAGRANEAALRSAIAHVFNAYGFFTADDTQAPGQADDPPNAGIEGDVPGSPSPGLPAGEEGPGELAHRPQSSPAPQASERSFAVHAGDRPPPPGPAGPGRGEGVGRADPFLRALQNRFEHAQLPDKANAKAVANRAAHAGQRDRVTLKIAENTVELIGRMTNLEDSEKQRLLDEIDSLLAAHGLSLDSATLNGETLGQTLGRTG